MYLLTQLSISDEVQTPRKIRHTDKISGKQNFSGDKNTSDASAKISDRKKLWIFFDFFRKNSKEDCSLANIL